MRLRTRPVITLMVLLIAFSLVLTGCRIEETKSKDKDKSSQSDKSDKKTSKTNDSSDDTDSSDNKTSDSGKDNGSSSNSGDKASGKDSSATDNSSRTKGEYKWANGDKYSGDLLNGLPDGQGEYSHWNVAWDDWQTIYKGSWKNGKMNGQGSMEFGTDGNYFDGAFVDNKPSGQGTLRCPGETFTGKWTTVEKNGHYWSTCDKGGQFSPPFPGETY